MKPRALRQRKRKAGRAEQTARAYVVVPFRSEVLAVVVTA
jgi:hypothetical protein